MLYASMIGGWLLAGSLVLAAESPAGPSSQEPARTPAAASGALKKTDGVADLRDTLVNGLRATRPEEIAWLDQVVAKVQENRLPLPLVLSTFKWARNRHPSYPFPYFKRGLKVRAARLGIPL